MRIVLLSLILFSPVWADPSTTAKKLSQLEARQKYLLKLHKHLTTAQVDMAKLHTKAKKVHQGNLAQAFLKGSYDAAQKFISPWSGPVDVATDLAANVIYDENKYWGVRREHVNPAERTKLVKISREVAAEYDTLRSMNKSLIEVFKAPLKRFDDAREPIKWTKSWWVSNLKEPDKALDAPVTLVTRKMNILVHLSKKISERAGREGQKVAAELPGLARQIAALRDGLEAEKIRAQLKAKFPPSKKTPPPTINRSDLEGMREPLETQELGRPVEDRKKMEKIEAERRKLRKALDEKRKKREAGAEIYVDAVCPRHVTAGDKAVFIAKIHPEDLAGQFEWTIDDKVVRRQRLPAGQDVLIHSFAAEDVHDLQVTLSFDGKFQDRYTTRITVHKPEQEEKPKVPRYPAKLEGKKVKALDMEWCKYWILHKDNHLYMTGYYYVPSGQRINYTSKPMAFYSPAAPAAGLIMAMGTKTGYHVYQAEADGLKAGQALYYVTRMRGTEIKILHKLKVHGHFSMKLTKNGLSWIVNYKTQPKGPTKTLYLK